MLNAGGLDDAQLARLDVELSHTEYQSPVRRALAGERAMGLPGFDNPVQTLIAMGMDARQASQFPKSSEDKPMYLQVMREMIDAFAKTGLARRQAAQVAEDRLVKFASTSDARRRYPLTLLIVPAIAACAEAANRNEAESDVIRAALAVERFYLAERRLPSKLDELAPRFLASRPIDPCDGQPLRYRVEPSEYIIYSVGPNGVDDGGRPAPSGQGGDAVARVRRKDVANRP